MLMARGEVVVGDAEKRVEGEVMVVVRIESGPNALL
jgi:hypothetical protein